MRYRHSATSTGSRSGRGHAVTAPACRKSVGAARWRVPQVRPLIRGGRVATKRRLGLKTAAGTGPLDRRTVAIGRYVRRRGEPSHSLLAVRTLAPGRVEGRRLVTRPPAGRTRRNATGAALCLEHGLHDRDWSSPRRCSEPGCRLRLRIDPELSQRRGDQRRGPWRGAVRTSPRCAGSARRSSRPPSRRARRATPRRPASSRRCRRSASVARSSSRCAS